MFDLKVPNHINQDHKVNLLTLIPIFLITKSFGINP